MAATTARTAGPGHPFDLRFSPSIDDVIEVGRSYPTEVLPCA